MHILLDVLVTIFYQLFDYTQADFGLTMRRMTDRGGGAVSTKMVLAPPCTHFLLKMQVHSQLPFLSI